MDKDHETDPSVSTIQPGAGESKHELEHTKHIVRSIMQSAEAIRVAVNPEAYEKEFSDRFEQAHLRIVMKHQEPGEMRWKLSLNEAGERVQTPIVHPDVNDLVNELYTGLEDLGHPVISVLKEIQQAQSLQGTDFGQAVKYCVIMAAQALPGLE